MILMQFRAIHFAVGLIPMLRSLAVSFAALMLSGAMLAGCSTALDGATEDLRIDIAGTGEALCDVTQPGRRYRAYAPGIFRVMKSSDDLRIRCSAPGNREQTVILKPQRSKSDIYNIYNGYVPGMLWDNATGARYEYPEYVLIDFSATPATSYPLPDYQQVFAKNPGLVGMEEFRPGHAALQSDLGQAVPTLRPREAGDEAVSEIMMPSASAKEPPTPQGATAGSGTSAAATATTTNTSTTKAEPAATGAKAPPNPATGTSSGSTESTGLFKNKSPMNSSSGGMKIFTNKIGTTPDTPAQPNVNP